MNISIPDIKGLDIKTKEDKIKIDAVEVKIVKLHPRKELAAGNSIQNGLVADAQGNQCDIAIWGHEAMDGYVHKTVVIEGILVPRKGHSLVVKGDFYREPKNVINVYAGSKWTVLANAAAKASAPAGGGGSSNTTSSPQNSGPIVVNGAKVGMAINCATELMVSGLLGDALFPKGADRMKVLAKVASDIIKISCKLENGELVDALEDAKTVELAPEDAPARPAPKTAPAPDEDVPF